MKTLLFVVLVLLTVTVGFSQGTRSNLYTITIADTTIYEAGQTLGAKFTITNKLADSTYQLYIMGVMVYDKGKQAANMTLVIMDSSVAQGTDSLAFAIGDSTLHNIVAVIPITTWKSFSVNAIGYSTDIREMVPRKPRLYGQLIADATATFLPGDLKVRLNLMWSK